MAVQQKQRRRASNGGSKPDPRGLDSVRIKKADLLKDMRKNRDEHRKIFEKAIDAWHKQAIERLEQMVKEAKKGPEAVVFHLGMPRPDDHTGEYDRIIRMLEMSQDPEVILSAHEFSQYVMDEWGWQHAFLASTSSYSPEAAAKLARMS